MFVKWKRKNLRFFLFHFTNIVSKKISPSSSIPSPSSQSYTHGTTRTTKQQDDLRRKINTKFQSLSQAGKERDASSISSKTV
jgi:hypothetical protein